MTTSRCPRLALATALACLAPMLASDRADAQSPAFLFTVTTRSGSGTPNRFVSADVGYGERVFGGIGVNNMEQRIGAQLALSSRVSLLAQAGFASHAVDDRRAATVRSELVADLLGARSSTVLAIGIGAGREYSRQALALGRVVVGYRTSRWEAMSNVRLERAVGTGPLSSDGTRISRDGIDVITTAGVMRTISPAVRLGVEAVGEDLEGLFDDEEAEGGAKLMIGPTIGLAPADSRWKLLLGGGPVLRLTTSSTVTLVPTASRELTTKNGYLVRASVSYRW